MLGQETIAVLSQHGPKHIFFTGRQSQSAEHTISQIRKQAPAVGVTFIQCDQTSLGSVESAAKEFLAQSQRLDVLLCNAGVMGKDAGLTQDGYEYHFGINHMAHALMVKLLLPTLQRTASQTGDARIIFMSSVGFRWTPSGGIVFKELKTTQDYSFAGRWVRYGQSKLANVVYASELANHHPDLTSVSVHPGVIWTNLWDTKLSLLNRIFVYLATLGQAVPVREGVYNACWAMTTERQNISSGAFYEPVGIIGSQTKNSRSKELGEQLRNWTEEELKAKGH